jgi:tRNA-Thr(GGU) m(6)t(6)A37 methyltransferase TsaA
MNIEPIAFFHSPMTSKFGIPRQSGLAPELPGQIVFEPSYRNADAVRGLEAFDYLWVIWGFSANRHEAVGLTVRPPRLGGNERVGVFASRSPYRPNGLGLSSLYIKEVEMSPTLGPVIHVLGADLMDGTPVYDIKPYVTYADCHPDARSGFVDSHQWQPMQVEIPESLARFFSDEECRGLRQVLSHDPRPPYHDDEARVYGMPFAGRDVRFRVADGVLTVTDVRIDKRAGEKTNNICPV